MTCGGRPDEAAPTIEGAAAVSARARLDDVAARVGVSPASVSLVLRNMSGPSAQTRRRVLEAAAELGYRPDRTASLLARRRTHLLGVMMDIRSIFHAELVEDLHDAAEHNGYDVVLSTVTRTRNARSPSSTAAGGRSRRTAAGGIARR